MTPVARVDGPLPLVELSLTLRAAASVCDGYEGKDHNILTATDAVRDRVEHRSGFPELFGLDLSDLARVQVAAALCRAIYGRVPDNPVAAAIRWQLSIKDGERALMLGQMLVTAADQVSLEAVNARAAALLGIPLETALAAVDERA